MALGAIIGGALSLFGARRAEKREDAAIAAQNAYNDPAAIRARAEKAGFNPLLFVGPGVGLQTAVGGTNYMGSAIADFAQTIGGLVDQRQLARANNANQAIQRKAKAQQKLTRMALRPKVAGPLELARAKGGDARALGLVPANSGSTVPVLPATSGLGTLPASALGSVPLPDPTLDRGTGNFVAGSHIPSPAGTSPVAVLEEEYGDSMGMEVEGTARWLLTRPGPAARAGLDAMGVTTPGRDYWTFWGNHLREAGKRLARGTAGPSLAVPKPKKAGFWAYYGVAP